MKGCGRRSASARCPCGWRQVRRTLCPQLPCPPGHRPGQSATTSHIWSHLRQKWLAKRSATPLILSIRTLLSLRASHFGVGGPISCLCVLRSNPTGNPMRLTSSLLAVSALAACALFAGASVDKSSSASAASSCAISGTWRETQLEGGACCMPDHFHSGVGSGSSKGAALANAAENRAGLVDFEYGSAFRHFSLAHSKTINCSTGGGWTCTVEARPCRR